MKAFAAILTFTIYVLGTAWAQPLQKPEIFCISVQTNGSVQITWGQVPDPNSVFQSYDLYDGGGNLITSIGNIGTTTHVHAGAGANASSQSYYLQSVANNPGLNSGYSDTVRSIFLNVVNPSDGTAFLSWNPIHDPNLPSASNYYHIYQEYPMGTWTLIDSTPYGVENYTDTITICDDQINYRITVQGNGCTSDSNVDGDNFMDLIAPYAPEIQFVTVDTSNGNATISWDPSVSTDAQGYIILNFVLGIGWTIIDTVWGYGNTIYVHAGAGADAASQGYGVAAFDGCVSATTGSPNTSAMGTFHETIFMTYSRLVCEHGVDLSWTDYINWGGGVDFYEIYASENGGPDVLMGTTSNTSFQMVGLNTGSTYCFTIRANQVGGGAVSLSNKVCYAVYTPVQPMVGYIATATVSATNQVEVRYMGDPNAALQAIKIERSLSPAGPFETIGTTAVTGPITSYVDQDVATFDYSYYYRVTAIDTCGSESVVSNLARTILMTVSSDEFEHRNTLTWNYYGDFDGGVQEYNVYRSTNGSFDPIPIATLNPAAQVLEDDVSGLLDTYGEFCYYIEAVENTNSYGFSETSHSNVLCVRMDELVWVPNAIVVNGVNQEFKPSMGYVNFDEYEMRIYDRWGQLIFETKDVQTGWRGEMNGKLVESGVYVYHITYRNSSGDYKDKRGSVTVVR